MSSLYNLIDAFSLFMETGGNVLWLIFAVSAAMWCLIIERLFYLHLHYPRQSKHWQMQWSTRQDRYSTKARNIRQALLSQAKLQLTRHLILIKTLIALCPLLGLLGTVTGMISVFDVMAVTGTGNARAMATGVSRATIPTMAGMVIAISGLYFSNLIENQATRESRKLADFLLFEKQARAKHAQT